MPPHNSECFRGKRAYAAGFRKTSSSAQRFANSESLREQGIQRFAISGIQPSGALRIGNYFGDDCGPGERAVASG